MQYQILVQDRGDETFVAAIIGIPDCAAEGPTKEEALARVKAALLERLAHGEVLTIEIETAADLNGGNPWLKNLSRFKDDQTFDDFLAEVQANRQNSNGNEAAE